jgi:hypothetical protein
MTVTTTRDTTETGSEQISSRCAREVTTAPSGGESDSPSSRPPRDELMFCLEQVDPADECEHGEPWSCCAECGCHCETRGTVSWAPAGTDPREVDGWTNVGWTDEAAMFTAGDDLDDTCHGVEVWDTATIKSATMSAEFPKVSRDTILLAMGQDPAELAPWQQEWPVRDATPGAIMRRIIEGTMLQPFQPRIIRSELVPPDMMLIGNVTHGVRIWPPEPRERNWWEEGMMAYHAAERIAMTVPRYDITVTSSVPTIGYPPLKSHGLGGRRYRAARRAYARKRRAWIRQGSPTYPTMIRMPQVVITGIA